MRRPLTRGGGQNNSSASANRNGSPPTGRGFEAATSGTRTTQRPPPVSMPIHVPRGQFS